MHTHEGGRRIAVIRPFQRAPKNEIHGEKSKCRCQVVKVEKLHTKNWLLVMICTVKGLHTVQTVYIRSDHLWRILIIRAKRHG